MSSSLSRFIRRFYFIDNIIFTFISIVITISISSTLNFSDKVLFTSSWFRTLSGQTCQILLWSRKLQMSKVGKNNQSFIYFIFNSRFQYGGCSGNENNYFSLGECERICLNPSISRKSTSPRRRNTCTMAEDAGTCDENVSRWRWDQSRAECVMFTWSGCGGNSNNFNTKDKCVFRCSDKN